MKKIVWLVFVFLLLVGISVSAEELTGEFDLYDPSTYPSEQREEMNLFSLDENEKQAVEALIQGIYNWKTSVNLSSYKIDVSRISHVVWAAIHENPELCYVDSTYSYNYFSYAGTSYVVSVNFSYMYTKDNVKLVLDAIEKEKAKVVAMVNDSMTDLEKLMIVHNYIVLNHEYDDNYNVYNIYGFFTQRTGVCSAYTKAMTYLLRAVGVECSFATSIEMDHTWNLVKIDGSWYHVDATWDDPNDDVGYCSYKYFLKSDSYFENYGGHYDWEAYYAATSAWYDNYYFEDYTTPFLYKNGEWYVQKRGSLYKIKHLKYGGAEEVFTPECKYASEWYPAYDMCFAVYGDSFIFNANNSIYVVNLNDYAEPRCILTYETKYHEVYSLMVDGSTLRYQTGSYSAVDTHTLDITDLVAEFYFEIISVVENGEDVKVMYTYDDLYEGNWSVYVAAYDENNTVIYIKQLRKNYYTVQMPEAYAYEAFIWEGCMPLCDSKRIE